tara:strand:- start:748 stop:1803 length:1056 start_codon:yes stop_codon:yes gene_type:complete
MDNLTKYLNNIAYKFPKGYPDMDNPEDKKMLFEIIENFINEDEEVDIKITDKDITNNKTSTITSSEELYDTITTKYAVDGQDVLNVENFYNSIQKSPNSNNLLTLIQNGGNKKLSSGNYSIKGIEKELYDLIMGTIKIPNGEPSELWVAFMYKGEIKGGVAGDTGITSDVDINGQGVSLKNYASIATLDFGSLGKTVEELLRDTINLFQILSGLKVKKTLTRNSINAILDAITSPDVESDMEEIIQMAETTNIATIKRLAAQIQSNLEDGDPKSLVRSFCRGIDVNIADKLNEVSWWMTINKGIVYTSSNKELFEKLRCTEDNRLSYGVSNFKDLHLFVNGNYLYKSIAAK